MTEFQELGPGEAVLAAGLAEVIETDGEAEFAGLNLFAAQLADQARGFAEGEGQGGLVIGFVVRKGGVAGDGGAVLDSRTKRFVPLAVGEQPQLLAPRCRISAGAAWRAAGRRRRR